VLELGAEEFVDLLETFSQVARLEPDERAAFRSRASRTLAADPIVASGATLRLPYRTVGYRTRAV